MAMMVAATMRGRKELKTPRITGESGGGDREEERVFSPKYLYLAAISRSKSGIHADLRMWLGSSFM